MKAIKINDDRQIAICFNILRFCLTAAANNDYESYLPGV